MTSFFFDPIRVVWMKLKISAKKINKKAVNEIDTFKTKIQIK